MPDTLLLTEIRHCLQRIDSSGTGRSGIRADRNRIEPRGAVFRHRTLERLHIQAEPLVARNHADALPPYAGDDRRSVKRGMALVAHVYGRALGMEGCRRLAFKRLWCENAGVCKRRCRACGMRIIQ